MKNTGTNSGEPRKLLLVMKKGGSSGGTILGRQHSVRFQNDMSETEIRKQFDGSLDPSKSGFFISDLPRESIEAANESVDFSTLFLSLGFFIISVGPDTADSRYFNIL